MTSNPGLSRALAAALVVCGATTALAADYVITRPTGLYEAPPVGATQLFITQGAGKSVALPFPFQYWGKLYSTVGVSPYGYVQFGVTPTPAGSSNESFPTTNNDGVCAAVWVNIKTGQSGFPAPNDVFSWTSGTAPNRKFIVSWENVSFNTIGSHGTFQIQLHEATGIIVFAYKTDASSNWNSFNYASGMDSPGDSRWMANPSWNQWANFPVQDQMFTPHVDVFSGRLLWDKLVSDAGGIGNSTMPNQPLAGMRVELRRDGATVVNTTTTAADGSFSMPAWAVPTASLGGIYVPVTNSACTVKTAAGATREWQVQASLPFGADVGVGTLTLPATSTLSAAFNVARTIAVARDWAVARASSAVLPLNVTFDDSSAASTNYSWTQVAQTLVVGGPAASDFDAWDDPVLVRTYARHLIASIAAVQANAPDYRYGAATDPQNAFAEGFGYYVNAAITGQRHFVNGTGPATATDIDVEDAAAAGPAGEYVAGRVAAALYDLWDGANETVDPVNGASTPARVLEVVDSFATAPTAPTFLQAWMDAGLDPVGITRVYVGDGLLDDDASESNDSFAEKRALGAVGLRKSGLALNRFNDDWFSFTLPASVAALGADLVFDRTKYATGVVFEVRDPSGTVIATGEAADATSPFHATTGPLPAGTYALSVRYTSGGTLSSYAVQVYEPIAIAATPLRDWTVGRRIVAPLGLAGGVPPYILSTPGSAMPPGLGLDALAQTASGTPTAPARYTVVMQVQDAANPANIATTTQTISIHDEFKIPLPQFVGFPAGKWLDLSLPTHEGTPPFTLAMTSGALPAGLSFEPNTFRLTGTAATGPASAFALDGTDAAGSADHVATRAVMVVEMNAKKVPADLAAGSDACGWWFDAVAGSTATFTVSTAKGRAKRTLAGVLLAPDRSVVVGGTIKGKPGSLAATKLPCPKSGRYCFIASGADAGEATQLVGTLTVKLPKSGKNLFKTFAPNATTTFEIGAVPGSTATVKFSGEKKPGLVAKVVAVRDPTGASFPFKDYVKDAALGGTLTFPLATGGTWTVVLGASSKNGTPGKLTYSYVVAQKKGAVYSAE